jgi:hypothetical protein
MTRYLRQYFVLASLLMAATSVAVAGQVYANIPPGARLQVRIIEQLSSETANVGDRFHGTLAAAVVANGRTLFSKGAHVTGEVVNVERSGRLSRPGELYLSLRTIRSGGRTYALAAEPFIIKGESHTKSNVTKIGGGAAAGAIIGAVAGGGKGAVIGTWVGAAAGTGVAAATGKKAAEVESEAVLIWVAAKPQEDAGLQVQGRQPSDGSRYSEDDGRASRGDRRARSNDEDEDYDDQGPVEFSQRERHIISDCFVDNRSGLPPGLAKRDRLPPGLERQLRRNGTLPPGLQKRVQPLPDVCTARLPRLPQGWARVVLSGRVILLDPTQRIVDLFWLGSDD